MPPVTTTLYSSVEAPRLEINTCPWLRFCLSVRDLRDRSSLCQPKTLTVRVLECVFLKSRPRVGLTTSAQRALDPQSLE